MKRYIKTIVIAIFIVSSFVSIAGARDIKFEVSIDKKQVALGESGQLGLTFYGDQTIPMPDLGKIDGLDIRYIGPSTMMTVINGRISTSITHMYSVAPLRTGKFQLGPFSFRYKGNDYSSNMAIFEAVEERGVVEESAADPAAVEKFGLEDRIFLTLNIEKSQAYVNELIPVTVKLYVNRLNVSDIQLPTFGQEGFSKVEFKEPKKYREELNGLIYDVLEFRTEMFGTRPGDYNIGPAKMKCNMMERKRVPRPSSAIDSVFDEGPFADSFFDDFFVHYERRPLELKSDSLRVAILPLPEAGRPSSFSGAVGDYQFIYNANPKKVKVGEPITVNMDINGAGNFNTVLMPKIEMRDGFKTYEPTVKTEANRKTFTQVLIPENELVKEIPAAAFSYFDPNKREYKTIRQAPISMEVEKGKEESSALVVSPTLPVSAAPVPLENEKIGTDIIYIKDTSAGFSRLGYRIYKSRLFQGLLLFPLLLLLTFYFVRKRIRRLERDKAYAGRVMALRSARKGLKQLRHMITHKDAKGFYDALFNTLQDYFGYRLAVAPRGVTYDVINSDLALRDVDPNILRKIKNLFARCDSVKFAAIAQDVDEFHMIDDSKELEEAIKYLERMRI